jgi:RNA polymerase sigma factor (sigma-70 family)
MEQYEWRKIKGFGGYEISNAAEVRNASTKQILTRTDVDSVILMVDGVRHNRGVLKLFNEAFPELKQSKKPKVLEYEGDNEISREPDLEYQSLEQLARTVVANGHKPFRSKDRVLEPIWTREAKFGSGQTTIGSYEAEDLVQEAIMAGYAALKELDVKSRRPSSYVAKSMRNKLYNLVNNLDPYETSLDYTDENGEEATLLDVIGTDPNDDELSMEDRHKFNRLRKILTEDEFNLIYDYHGLDYTMSELAAKYDVARETISNRLSRIKQKVKENF